MKEFSCSTEQVVHTGFSFRAPPLKAAAGNGIDECCERETKQWAERRWVEELLDDSLSVFATTPFTLPLVLLSIVNIKQRSMKAPLRSWKVSRPSLFWSESMFLLIYQKQSYKTVIQYLMICRHTKHHTVLLTYNRPKLIFSLFIRHISMFRTLTAHFEAT